MQTNTICLGNSTSHSGLMLPQPQTIKRDNHLPQANLTWAIPQLRLSFPVTLGCMKLSINANQDTFQYTTRNKKSDTTVIRNIYFISLKRILFILATLIPYLGETAQDGCKSEHINILSSLTQECWRIGIDPDIHWEAGMKGTVLLSGCPGTYRTVLWSHSIANRIFHLSHTRT